VLGGLPWRHPGMSAWGGRVVGSYVGIPIEAFVLPAIGCVGVSSKPRTMPQPLRVVLRQAEQQTVD
jgi:hypothetical protein